ncbi:MAG: DUF4129 domain-containing protein [Dehalococcoidia bacterium]|nr:DUF4129 domain-containing protein [Dehalococcoidia bacterium]
MGRNSRLLYWAILLMEATWWYTLVALGGVLVGLGNSPLHGIGVLLLLGAAAALSLALQSPHLDLLVAQGVSMAIALGAIYLAIALGGGGSAIPSFNLLWILDTVSGHSTGRELGHQVLGGLAGIVLWWRGMEIGAAPDVEDLLFRSFKIGLIVITVGAVIDALAPISVGMTWVGFVFFLVGLSALMLNQFQGESEEGVSGRRWMQIALGVLGAVLLTGILLSLVAVGGAASLAGWLFGAVGDVVRGVVLLVALPLAYAMGYAVSGLQWLIAHLFGQGEATGDLLQGSLGALQELRDLAKGRLMPDWLSGFLAVLRWAGLIYVALVFLFFLYLAFVRRQPGQRGREVRAFSRGQTPLWSDLASLLSKLFPQPKAQVAEDPPPQPRGSEPRRALLRLYYTTLNHFQQRGLGRQSFETPWEYESHTLARVWPGGGSSRLTRAFNTVRYGRQEPEAQDVRQMEEEVKQALETVAEQGPRR